MLLCQECTYKKAIFSIFIFATFLFLECAFFLILRPSNTLLINFNGYYRNWMNEPTTVGKNYKGMKKFYT